MNLNEHIELLEGALAESRLNALRALRRKTVQTVQAPSGRLLSVLKAKIARDTKSSKGRPQMIGFAGSTVGFSFDGKKDVYLHYTTRENAVKILKDMELKVPEAPQGQPAFSTFVVSLTYGILLPSVQHTGGGLRDVDRKDIVGILFKSDKQPKVGFPEETVFGGGTKIKSARMVDGRKLKEIEDRLANNRLVPEPLDYEVHYTVKGVEDFRTSMNRRNR